ncbi:MAG: hypothetical protein AAB932_06085 [Patescibacteria group bacterium]
MNAAYLTKQLKFIEDQLAIIRMAFSQKEKNKKPNVWKETAGALSKEQAHDMLRAVEISRTEADRIPDPTV